MFKHTLAPLAAVFMLSGCVIHIDPSHGRKADRHLTEQLELDAGELDRLIADTTNGDIKVVGVPGLERIEVTADIYTSKDKGYTLTLQRRGDSAELHSGFESGAGLVWYSGNSPHIDLTVRVPARFNLELDDGSGDLHISGVQGNMDIQDGSGDLWIDGGHRIKVEDGSGELTLRNATSDVTIDDGSGDLHIEQVSGSVYVEDGSGDLYVENVSGLVTLDDGSGDINLKRVGDVKLLESGSGGVYIDGLSRD